VERRKDGEDGTSELFIKYHQRGSRQIIYELTIIPVPIAAKIWYPTHCPVVLSALRSDKSPKPTVVTTHPRRLAGLYLFWTLTITLRFVSNLSQNKGRWTWVDILTRRKERKELQLRHWETCQRQTWWGRPTSMLGSRWGCSLDSHIDWLDRSIAKVFKTYRSWWYWWFREARSPCN